jgi:magnesium transporter
MNPKVFALSEDMTAGEAITAVQSARDVEVVFYLYIIDNRRHLVGVASLRRLLLVPPSTPLKRIMTTDIISVRVDMDQEEVARQVASYNLLAIPVVDNENKLVGVITVDDVIDVIKDEATEDVYRLAGVSSDDRVFTRPSESLRKRLPWLLVNLATAFVAASIVSIFTGTIAVLPIVAVLMPVVAGMGGNAATQTLTVIVRGIALGELTWGNTRKALLKEAAVGLGNGIACGIMGALVVTAFTKGDWLLGVVLGMAMIINMFVAATAGTMIPLLLRALKVDPALASSVFITTLTDMFGFFSFLGLAHLFVGYLHRGG